MKDIVPSSGAKTVRLYEKKQAAVRRAKRLFKDWLDHETGS
jgi:hypothetical protein